MFGSLTEHRTFIALSGASPAGNPAYIDDFAETVVDPDASPAATSMSAFERSCDEFVKFYTQRRLNALQALPTSQADQERHKHFPMRTHCFRPGTRMYHALSPVETRYGSPEKRRAVDNCRLACLIYLNAVISDYGDFSPKTEEFFTAFSKFIEDDDYDCSLAAEHLLWSLVRGIEERKAYERTWMVSRMMGVVKRANWRIWIDVETALRLFLVIPDNNSELIQYLSTPDAESLRQEVMAFSQLNLDTDYGRLSGPLASNQPFNARFEDSDFLPETRDVQVSSHCQH